MATDYTTALIVCSQADLMTNAHQKERATHHVTQDDVPVRVKNKNVCRALQGGLSEEIAWFGGSEASWHGWGRASKIS